MNRSKPSHFGALSNSLKTRLSVREGGSGPVVVLIHGLGASSRYFVPLAQRLAENQRVIVPELPGHGKNMGDGRPISVERFSHEVALALRELAVDRAVVLGHSMGAQVAIELARSWPGLVEHLLLAAPAVNDREATVMRQALRLLQDFPHESAPLRAILTVDYLRCGLPWWTKSCTMMFDYPTLDRLATVRCPVDIICGSRDTLSPPEFGLRLAARAPEARLTVARRAAHGVNFTHAPLLAELIPRATSREASVTGSVAAPRDTAAAGSR